MEADIQVLKIANQRTNKRLERLNARMDHLYRIVVWREEYATLAETHEKLAHRVADLEGKYGKKE